LLNKEEEERNVPSELFFKNGMYCFAVSVPKASVRFQWRDGIFNFVSLAPQFYLVPFG
jgi:hypothetical protein